MDIQRKLELFDQEIEALQDLIFQKRQDRVDWCRDNSKDIKLLMPKKNRLYKILDYQHSSIGEWTLRDMLDEQYYFRVNDRRLHLANHIAWREGPFPTVQGEVLDANKNIVVHNARISMFSLEESNDLHLSHQEKETKVYVMIDKNTGYYKIGRSVKPRYRERTLQSEKPTIELLFSFPAKVKDEKCLHDMFSEQRIRGEWFDLRGSDLERINQYFYTQ